VSEVWIRGAAMTRFSKHVDRGARDLVEEAVAAALRDARVEPARVQAAYVGNAWAGLMTGQECLRGQVVLRRTGLAGVPVVNVDNACASSATALHLGWQAVTGGLYDCVVVLGYETIDHQDRRKRRRAIDATMDLDELADVFGSCADGERDVYAGALDASLTGDGRDRFDRDLLALVSVKNRYHGSLNACAHHRTEVTIEQVLESPAVARPLTRMMCAQLSDGAACLVLCSGGFRAGRDGGVRIAASVLSSGRGDDMRRRFSVGMAARQAYEAAAVGPADLDVVELYDGTAVSELHLYRELGLCPEGDEDRLLTERTTWLGGRVPVNPSGGLIARGHPIGATGAAQVVELAWQLEGRCGGRQVPGARLALAETTGGWVGSDVAACCIHVLQA
jgi:acetyl-CoA acetyltransferase